MKNQKFIVIAVDGGAASGKSSTSRGLTKKFNLLHIDTGAHYRTISLSLLNAGIKNADEFNIKPICFKDLVLGTKIIGNEAYMSINGIVPNDEEIRNNKINSVVSGFAALPEVRKYLLGYQRSQKQIALESGFSGIIMDGRDIGSVVLPDADFRFFLVADPEARRKRREAEGIVDSIIDRDKKDSERKVAPLTCPEGGILIDSTFLTLEEVIEKISKIIIGE